jgi:capsular polysaccharide export protein
VAARLEGIACLAGIAPWKRGRVIAMLSATEKLPHARDAAQAVGIAQKRGGAVACWNSRQPKGLPELAAAAGVPVWSVEDGFIRSAGLGAALVQPCSLVLDSRGAHYDSALPSDLEVLLENAAFTPAQLERAARLIERLCARGITKYNLGEQVPDLPQGQPFVLVLGQVDDDLSVQLGGAGQTVAGMIEAVRRDEAGRTIVFKPHPDVSAGLRRGVTSPEGCISVPDADLLWLIERAARVHVLTSLGGFEALLRGREVVVHGQPFYAGWGLTHDRNPLLRRTRRLSLAELAAGALIEYPLYFDPDLGQRCTVEHLLDRIAAAPPARPLSTLARLRGQAALRLASLKRAATQPGA